LHSPTIIYFFIPSFFHPNIFIHLGFHYSFVALNHESFVYLSSLHSHFNFRHSTLTSTFGNGLSLSIRMDSSSTRLLSIFHLFTLVLSSGNSLLFSIGWIPSSTSPLFVSRLSILTLASGDGLLLYVKTYLFKALHLQ